MTNSRLKLAGVVLAIALSAGACAGSISSDSRSENVEPSAPIGIATVERVVDGDTVILDINGQSERVRLIGLDTPESVTPNMPQQCFGAEAAQALSEILPPGTEVRIERDVEARDRFDRLLLYLYRQQDALFINQWLIEQGFAESVSYPPNVAFQSEFDRVRNQARATGTGLWGVCDGPDQPLD